jgi:Ser/Thr protein kinase RdoA (MazF antagonist)
VDEPTPVWTPPPSQEDGQADDLARSVTLGHVSPKHAGWTALAEAVAAGARVTRLRRLTGGAGGTDAYDVTLDRVPHRVAVKIYRDGDGTAPSEWSRLQFAQRVAAPVPKPIAADLESVWFGRPAIVMSRLPGRPDVTPKVVDSWVAALAQTLAQFHQTALDGFEGALPRPPWTEPWQPAAGEHDPLTAAAVSAVTARLPSLSPERVFTHGDFHPGNVLWHRGHLSGVVDWSAARLDARWSEVAYCRADVCLLLGPDIADRLAHAYSDIVGSTSDELAVYDVMWVVNMRNHAEVALEAYRGQGYAPNYQLSLSRLDEQLRRALERLDR